MCGSTAKYTCTSRLRMARMRCHGTSACVRWTSSGMLFAASPITMKSSSTARIVLGSCRKVSKAIPWVKVPTSVIASRISRIRSRHDLRDIHAFRKHLCAQPWLQTRWGPQVDRAAEEVLEAILQSEEAKEPDGTVKFHENIHVALLGGVITGDRAK